MPDPGIPVIVYEDNHLFVLHKPSGWLVQGDQTGDRTIIDWGKEYLKKKYSKPGNVFLHPAHRLDRPVSGLLILARTSKALSRLHEMFRENRVEKSYLAIVEGSTSGKQTLRHWLRKDKSKNRVQVYNRAMTGAKEAILDYESMAIKKKLSLLLVKLHTGRSHQIRAQISSTGHPIVGDIKYGSAAPNPDKSISLHAFRLDFEHPVKKERMELKSLPENENWDIFRKEINALD